MVLGDAEHTPDRYVAMSPVAASLELRCDVGELERAAAACPALSPAG